jgi:hypothetical protein
MSSETTITLELTDFEASALMAILMQGVDWHNSGDLGKAAEAMYDALGSTGADEAHWSPSNTGLAVWRALP